MKNINCKFSSIIIFFLALMLVFSSCENSSKKTYIEEKAISVCDATEEDFSHYNSAFTTESVIYSKDNYRLVKATFEITNNYNFSIGIEDAELEKSDYFYVKTNCVDIEPTYPITSKDTINVDVYIYINNKLQDKKAIINELNNESVNFIILKFEK